MEFSTRMSIKTAENVFVCVGQMESDSLTMLCHNDTHLWCNHDLHLFRWQSLCCLCALNACFLATTYIRGGDFLGVYYVLMCAYYQVSFHCCFASKIKTMFKLSVVPRFFFGLPIGNCHDHSHQQDSLFVCLFVFNESYPGPLGHSESELLRVGHWQEYFETLYLLIPMCTFG